MALLVLLGMFVRGLLLKILLRILLGVLLRMLLGVLLVLLLGILLSVWLRMLVRILLGTTRFHEKADRLSARCLALAIRSRLKLALIVVSLVLRPLGLRGS